MEKNRRALSNNNQYQIKREAPFIEIVKEAKKDLIPEGNGKKVIESGVELIFRRQTAEPLTSSRLEEELELKLSLLRPPPATDRAP